MRITKLLTSSLFLFTTALALAAAPEKPATDSLPSDTAKQNEEQKAPTALQKFQIDAVLGFNLTGNPNGNSSKNIIPNPQFAPVMGVSITLPEGIYYGIRGALLYSQNLYTNVTEPGVPYTYVTRLSYIEMPFDFQYKPTGSLCLFAGFDYSFLLKSAGYLQSLALNEATPQPFQNRDVRMNLIRLTGGIQYKISSLLVGVRMEYGSPYHNGCGVRNSAVGEFTLSFVVQESNRHKSAVAAEPQPQDDSKLQGDE